MKSINVSEDTFLYSLRYSLPRLSSAPSSVATDIINNLQSFTDEFLLRMIAEINKKPLPTETMELWLSLIKDIKHEIMIREAPWSLTK